MTTAHDLDIYVCVGLVSADSTSRPLLMRLRQHLPEDQQQYLVDFPLHAACSIGCVKEVGEHLDRVSQLDSYGNSPLYWAVKHKDPEIVEVACTRLPFFYSYLH